jgi:hypothetical protein
MKRHSRHLLCTVGVEYLIDVFRRLFPVFFTAFAFTVYKTLLEHTHSRLRKANMESTFTNAGYYDTKATDGRQLRIIFPFDDPARTKQIVIDTVKVLEAFAAKCTAGAPVCFSP